MAQEAEVETEVRFRWAIGVPFGFLRGPVHFYWARESPMRSVRAKRKRPQRRVSGPVVNQVVCVGRAAGGRWPTVSRL